MGWDEETPERAPSSWSRDNLSRNINKVILTYSLKHKVRIQGTSLAVQWLRHCASSVRCVGLIPGRGTESPHASRHQIRSDQSLIRVRLFVTPWITAHQASLSITNSRSSLRLTSIESVMPSSHLCGPLLLLPPIPPSIRVFSNESTLRMRWPKYWSCSFSWN